MIQGDEKVIRINRFLGALMLMTAAVLVMAFPTQTAQGINSGIELCLGKVIPSIFPMMLLCMIAVESGYARRAGRVMQPVSKALFGLPGEAAAAVLLSMVGGYPAGAKAVTELYRCGAVSRAQASRMALFCFSAGPAFLLGVVGGLTGSAAAGWLLMGVQSVAVITTGVLVCRMKPLPEETLSCAAEKESGSGWSTVIVASVSKSASAMLQVCLYVIVFSAVNALMNTVGLSALTVKVMMFFGMDRYSAEAVLPVLMEVTAGCVRSVGAGLPMMAFAVGFGGFSVQMQVLSITKCLGVKTGRFMAVRLFQGALSALLTAIAVAVLPEKAVCVNASFAQAGLSGSAQGAVMLVIMCMMCVMCLHDGSDSIPKIKR